jgi:hypothetical protein
VVDFLKPAAKSISKTNLANSENIFASNQKTLGQVVVRIFEIARQLAKTYEHAPLTILSPQ